MSVGRNDPCPRGSGKKRKKCCGRPFSYEIGGERFGCAPHEFQIEMGEKVARGEALW